MSGHSKWSTIRRKKGAADAKRGQIFTKLAGAIALAAREGADPTMNFKLRLAIDQARNANMPAANIERAIARGSGQDKDTQIQSVLYEAYGPSGVAIIISGATDNKNRTGSDVRSTLTKHGGHLAEPGSVRFQFAQRGVITIEASDKEEAVLKAIDAGAEDVEAEGNEITVYTKENELFNVRTQLQKQELKITSSEQAFIARQPIPINDTEKAGRIINLIEALENLDDITATYSNFDIPLEILEKIA